MKLSLLIPSLFLSMVAQGHEEALSIAPEDIVLEKTFEAGARTGELKIRIHKAGHLQGRPYVIEVSEKCNGDWQVIDAHSVCDLAKDTLRYLPKKSMLTILARDPIAPNPLQSQLKPTCEYKAQRVRFKLRSQCPKSASPPENKKKLGK